MKLRRSSGKPKKPSQVHAEETVGAVATSIDAISTRKRSGSYVVRRVVGDSMYPTLVSGQLVLAKRRQSIQPDDVVIFRHNNMEKIKRVREVENDRLYVVGDNPNFSTDSRHYGMIDQDDVLGTVAWPRI